MKFKKIVQTNSEEFKEAWEIYESSFPEDERRTIKAQIKLMKDKNYNYNFLVVYDNKKIVAIIAEWKFDNFVFIEHLAVKSELRSKGIGTKLLTTYLSESKSNVVLEVEKPNTDIAIKRIKFYEKAGFKLNKHKYIQPAYGEGKKSVPMFLMTYPDKINANTFRKLRTTIHTQVYGCKESIV